MSSTPALLVLDLKAATEAAFANTAFRVPQTKAGTPEAYAVPPVYVGALPPPESGVSDLDTFPWIVIRRQGGKTDEQDGAREDKLRIRWLFGVYTGGDEGDGETDLDTAIDRVRLMLGAQRFWDSNRWVREFPLTWEIGVREKENANPHPFYAGWLEATFSAPSMTDNDDWGLV